MTNLPTLKNPLIPGDRPDPTVVRTHDGYLMTHSSFDYCPGLVLWHSHDLVKWRAVKPLLKQPVGSVFAPELVEHDGRYFLYFPVQRLRTLPNGEQVAPDDEPSLALFVMVADDPMGEWSEPVDMQIPWRIDPGHVVGEDGCRYLFLHDGFRVRLRPDGLAADGPVEKVHGGWPIPKDWVIEGQALEAPKLLWRGGWLYLFLAQGGTGGPPTSHMVTVARSRSVHGPWEWCPHNPVVRTSDRAEKWWSRGHGSVVSDAGGQDWLVYHGYERHRQTLGRQTLMEPLRWDAQGWPCAGGQDPVAPMPYSAMSNCPALASGGMKAELCAELSNLFAGGPGHFLGRRLAFYAPGADFRQRMHWDEANQCLTLQGQGARPAEASPLALIAPCPRYEITVDVQVDGTAQAGLLLFYSRHLYAGLGFDAERLVHHQYGRHSLLPTTFKPGTRMQLRIVNDDHVASMFYRSSSEEAWTRHAGLDVSGYHHNSADGFLSLRPALYVCGAGSGQFSNARFHELN